MYGEWVSVAVLLGWLLLIGGGFASFKLGWKKNVQLALIWLAIFVGLFVVAHFLGAELPT